MWLMVVLIWVQTGFAMVILSAAIKAVPTELTEAARSTGRPSRRRSGGSRCRRSAHRRRRDHGLFVTVMKVFDIVYAMTNGNFGTRVIANQMWIGAFGQSNLGLGSALAVVLFVSVIPIMWINIRRMQRTRGAGRDDELRVVVNPDQREGSRTSRLPLPPLDPDVGAVAARGHLEHPHRRSAGQLGPHPCRPAEQWLVDRVARPRDLTLDNYREVLGTTAAGGMAQGLSNSLAIAHARDDRPDRLRRLRRMRVGVDRLQAPPGTLLSVPSPCSRCRCRSR